MTIRWKMRPALAAAGAVLAAAFASGTPAQQSFSSHQHDRNGVKAPPGELVKVVREATARYRDVRLAVAEGYELQFGCVSGGDVGAMGMHFSNLDLILDGQLDATRPEIVIYEPMANGRLRLIGADYLVFKDVWDEANPGNPPQLLGQLFHLFDAPNRFGLPPFYTLHVWAWKENPTGMFVNWHTDVSCDAFNGTLQ